MKNGHVKHNSEFLYKRRARSAGVCGSFCRRCEATHPATATRDVGKSCGDERSGGDSAFLQTTKGSWNPLMANIRVIHVGDLAASAGISAVSSLVSSFSCPPNNEVETFLKRNALDFTKRSVSITHLLVSPEDRECLGYFTLTHKPFSVKAQSLSNSQRKRMERFAKYDGDLGVYTVSAFLIAQIGKNFSSVTTVTGAGLMAAAFDRIAAAIHEIGGQAVFLECEDGNAKLKAFYEKNGFVACARRFSKEDGVFYLQMFRFLK